MPGQLVGEEDVLDPGALADVVDDQGPAAGGAVHHQADMGDPARQPPGDDVARLVVAGPAASEASASRAAASGRIGRYWNAPSSAEGP